MGWRHRVTQVAGHGGPGDPGCRPGQPGLCAAVRELRSRQGAAQSSGIYGRPTMSGIAAGGKTRPKPAPPNLGRRRAAGIYGAIVTAAILDTAGGHVSTVTLVISVVITLLVYWVAEEYAEVLGEQVEGGRLPSGARIRQALAASWPMVSASFLPLL